MTSPVVVIAWHGTRGASGRADTARITELVGRELSGTRVLAAFVDEDVQAPTLRDVLAAELDRRSGPLRDGGTGASENDESVPLVVVPAFVAAGYHVRHDIPAAVAWARERTGGVREVVVTTHLGVTTDGRTEPRLVEAILAAATAVTATEVATPAADGEPGDAREAEGGVVLATAGSSVPEVADEVDRLCAAVAERSGAGVRAVVLDGAQDDVTKGDVLVPLLIADGFFGARARRAGERCAPLLGEEPAVGHVVAALVERARAGLNRPAERA